MLTFYFQIGDKEKGLGAKISDDEKETIEKAVDEALSWLENNKDSSAEEIREQKKELEGKVTPIVSKLYEGQAPPPTGEESEAGSDDKDEL